MVRKKSERTIGEEKRESPMVREQGAYHQRRQIGIFDGKEEARRRAKKSERTIGEEKKESLMVREQGTYHQRRQIGISDGKEEARRRASVPSEKRKENLRW